MHNAGTSVCDGPWRPYTVPLGRPAYTEAAPSCVVHAPRARTTPTDLLAEIKEMSYTAARLLSPPTLFEIR